MLILSFLNINAQNIKDNLDNDFGFEFLKLGENYSDVIKKIDLYPYSCNYCEKSDSIAKKYSIKSLDKIVIQGVTTDRTAYLYFVDNLLYKIEILLPNNQLVQQNLPKFFIDKYGIENKKNGITKIWETKKTYLEVYIPNKVDENNKFSNLTIFSKEINEILNKKINEIKSEEPKNLSLVKGRKGNGNNTFIPDINNALKLLQKNSSRKNLEMLLPNYTVIDTLSTTFKYNEKTNNHDILDELVSKYTFMFKSEDMVFMEVYTKKGSISKIEYNFDINQDLNKLKKQIINNGFNLDARLSKVISKLGFNNCFVFTKNPSYNFTIYSEKRFSISK